MFNKKYWAVDTGVVTEYKVTIKVQMVTTSLRHIVMRPSADPVSQGKG